MTERRPKKGERYVVKIGFDAYVLTSWRAPFTGGKEACLPNGLEFTISDDPPAEATAVAALPLPYDQWELLLVDEQDRAAEKYGGYYLVVSFDALAEKCSRVS